MTTDELTFSTFVEVASSIAALRAARAACVAPAGLQNPFLLVGPSGVGKSHLLTAIVHAIQNAAPATSVHVDGYTLSIDKLLELPATGVVLFDPLPDYSDSRRVDWMVATLTARRVQVLAATTDRRWLLPQALRSGFATTLASPSAAERERILTAWADRVAPERVSPGAAEAAIAHSFDLAGARGLLVTALSSLPAEAPNTQVTTLDVQVAVRARGVPHACDIKAIQHTVAEYYNLRVPDMLGGRRHRAISVPRQIAMYLSRRYTGESYPEIGHRFGGKDHSTVMTAFRNISARRERDDVLAASLTKIETSLGVSPHMPEPVRRLKPRVGRTFGNT